MNFDLKKEKAVCTMPEPAINIFVGYVSYSGTFCPQIVSPVFTADRILTCSGRGLIYVMSKPNPNSLLLQCFESHSDVKRIVCLKSEVFPFLQQGKLDPGLLVSRGLSNNLVSYHIEDNGLRRHPWWNCC